MTTFQAQQVLRTKTPLKSETGKSISPGTRVVVMGPGENGKTRVKVADPKHDALKGERIASSAGAFTKTFRGRPSDKNGKTTTKRSSKSK